ncbi:hypothetical protein [Streptomyces halstedii]|uniref:Uncharacterized protein n=1 Tax=Streptomyces halstedii TaxID=1944 RepID=A0A6N9UFU9_STRHA|nr:hypothetical protein [Streptomyces halstedii]NEA19835.1 hypothetical protein [Streptomyces halstedii]
MQFARAILAIVTTGLAVTNTVEGHYFTAAFWTLVAACWLTSLAIDADRR